MHSFFVECIWHIDTHCCLDALVFVAFVYIYTITSTLPTHPNKIKSEQERERAYVPHLYKYVCLYKDLLCNICMYHDVRVCMHENLCAYAFIHL